MAEYDAAIDYFTNPNRVFIGQNACKAIVIHGTGGAATQTAQELGEWFRTNDAETSVHFGIDRSGVIAQYVHLADGAAGNCCEESGYDPFWQSYIAQYGNLNLCTLSIEHVNDLENTLPLTDVQKAASFKLIAWLCQQFNITPDHIKGHNSIAPGSRKNCPGPAYPWGDLWTYLGQQGGTMGIPSGWHDSNGVLTAPNGHKAVLGFRDYILSHNWDAQNYPLEEEHTQSPLEVSNPSLGNGTQQVFRWSCLEWTPTQGVFLAWIGQELLALRGQHK